MIALEKGIEVSTLIPSAFLFFLLPKKGDIDVWNDKILVGPHVYGTSKGQPVTLTYHCFSLLLAEMLSSPWACSFEIGLVISLFFLTREVSLLMDFFREPQTPIPHQLLNSAQFLVHVEGVHKGDVGSPVMSKGQPIPAPALLAHYLHHPLGVKRQNLKPGVPPWGKKAPKLGTWTTLIFGSYCFIGYSILSWQIFFLHNSKYVTQLSSKAMCFPPPLATFKLFFLSLVFRHFKIMCLSVFLFLLCLWFGFCFGIYYASGFMYFLDLQFDAFYYFSKNLYLCFQIFLLHSLFLSDSNYVYVR